MQTGHFASKCLLGHCGLGQPKGETGVLQMGHSISPLLKWLAFMIVVIALLVPDRLKVKQILCLPLTVATTKDTTAAIGEMKKAPTSAATGALPVSAAPLRPVPSQRSGKV